MLSGQYSRRNRHVVATRTLWAASSASGANENHRGISSPRVRLKRRTVLSRSRRTTTAHDSPTRLDRLPDDEDQFEVPGGCHGALRQPARSHRVAAGRAQLAGEIEAISADPVEEVARSGLVVPLKAGTPDDRVPAPAVWAFQPHAGMEDHRLN